MLEPLEQRIAPADVGVFPLTRTATWTDFDGDQVTLRWSTGEPPAFTTRDAALADRLIVDLITFGPTNNGANVTLSIKSAPGGNGRVDLGRIDATGVGLASWTSPRATIAEFDSGDGARPLRSFVSAGLGIVPVGSFSGASGNGVSLIDSPVGTVSVLGDIAATKLTLNAPVDAKIARLDIRGSLLGAVPADLAGALPSGAVEISGQSIGGISIGGSVVGGKGTSTGTLFAPLPIGNLTIRGSIVGGEGSNTGTLVLAEVKTLNVNGDVRGGSVASTGKISAGAVDLLTVGGSILGGSAPGTGSLVFSSVKTATVRGSIIGSAQLGGSADVPTAALVVNGSAGSVTINGDLLGGSNGSGSTSFNGALLFSGNVKTVTIKGSIRGTDGFGASIIAKGEAPASPGDYAAIGRLSVGGSVTFATIAAGHDYSGVTLSTRLGVAENPDAGIGVVNVGGDWLHANLLAGINDLGSNGVDSTDTRNTGDAARRATIGTVAIRGDILSSPLFAGASGFAAERIALITAGGQRIFADPSPDRALDPAGRILVRQI